ncbi:MAG: flippase-like domain-containing protein [Clostridia bacterium]|nr:flippase-like domain-containing protein [Clostridia bacterium]
MEDENSTMEINSAKKHKKNILKYLLNIFLFFILIYLTFSILFKNEDVDEIYSIIGSASYRFIFLGFLCMGIYYLCEAINLRRTLRALEENCTFLSAIKYVLIGVFFNSITPAASGGQPMQIVFMHRDGIKVPTATASLLLNLFSMQVVTITLEIVSAIFFHQYMDGGIIALFIIGIILNFSALTLIIIGMYSKKLSTALVNLVAKILKMLKIKNYEKVENSMQEALDKYNESAKYIRSNKRILSRQFPIAYLQHIAYYSVPFFVLCSFGLPKHSYILMVALQSIVFGTVSGIPSPGAVGVSEGAFQSIFRPIFTENYINSAMLLHRLVSFYLPVSICAIVVMVGLFTAKKKK